MDNGTCFVASCKNEINGSKEILTFCGVCSHHQNGKAENRIKIIFNPARNMIIHAMCRWPELVNQSLWPHAMFLATDIRNKNKLDKNCLSHIEKLSNTSQSFDIRKNHVFGFPFHVIDSSLQNHQSIPRLDERMRVGACLGQSKQHALNVSLIINVHVGYVSPQFHIVFDENFETVASLRSGIKPKRWKWLSRHRRELYLNDSDAIIDNIKVWTNTELERSTLFEVPK